MHPKDPELANQLPEGQWSTGLYDCCNDPSNSCNVQGLVYVAMGHTASGWLYGGIYRSKLRRHFSLPEAPCSDSLIHGCCCVCGLTQEYAELKIRGVDPSVGWKANVEKWNSEGLEPPIVAPSMTR